MKYLICLAALFFLGCGSSYEKDSDDTPVASSVTPEQQKAWDTTVKPIVTANCALAGCHPTAGFVKTPAAFLGSGAKGQVSSGKMPRGRTLTPDQKAALLNL